MAELKYKVGDKVRIKSLDWYKNNSDLYGYIVLLRKEEEDIAFDPLHAEYCGQIMTISSIVYGSRYIMENDIHESEWTDEMIECKVEEETKNNNDMEEKETLLSWIKESDSLRLVPHKDYEIKHDENNFYLVKKKKEYPKTYEECCKVLDWYHRDYDRVGYKAELLCKLQVLLLCRDAYWKIAGEEMGLGKPWEPDWEKVTNDDAIFFIEFFKGKRIVKTERCSIYTKILAFPTPELRDAFYENFKELIESCKELL